jgi:Leucine-rich repeat (LRR) protein
VVYLKFFIFRIQVKDQVNNNTIHGPRLHLLNFFDNLKFKVNKAFTHKSLNAIGNSKTKSELNKHLIEVLYRISEIEKECFTRQSTDQLPDQISIEINKSFELIDDTLSKLKIYNENDYEHLETLINQVKFKIKSILFNRNTILFIDEQSNFIKELNSENLAGKLLIIHNCILSNRYIDYLEKKLKILTSDKLTYELISMNILQSIEYNNEHIEEITLNKTNVTSLSFESMDILSIEIDAFMGLNNLIELNISNNRLEKIDSRVFNYLEKLEILKLNSNELYELEPTLFYTLGNLKFLDLSDNKLSFIHPALFFKLDKLEKLNLSSNRLKSIHPDILSKFKDSDIDYSYNWIFDKKNLGKIINDYSICNLKPNCKLH